MPAQRVGQKPGSLGMIRMRATGRFAENLVDAAELGNFRSGDAHGFRGKLLLVGIAPHDGRARLRRNHEVERIFENQHAVAHGQRQRSARSAFAGDHRNCRDAQPAHLQNVAGNCLRLAALFGAQTRKCAREVNEADDGPVELFGYPHAA